MPQMDSFIDFVAENLPDDSLLIVMGDHGMTESGDHGGESQLETDAALFAFSTKPLQVRLIPKKFSIDRKIFSK
jgi:phosphatidylinositol glycan class O